MEATIIIPVYNQCFYTRCCLASLQQLPSPEAARAEVVVVDNGSSDDTPAVLAEWETGGPNRRTIRNDENLGFARACNSGAAIAGGEFLVFLNNDTFVLPGWLDYLLRPFAGPTVHVTGSRLLYPSGHIQHAGVAFDDMGPHHVFVGVSGDSQIVLEERDFQVVTGASLAIRHEVFDRLHGFDTTYQNSFEDVDLCLRVRQDGGRVVYTPSSVAYHYESMTEGRVGPTDDSNYNLFMSRWATIFERDLQVLHAEAERREIDLNHDRMPSRRDVMEGTRRLKEIMAERAQAQEQRAQAESRLAEVEARLAEVESRMHEQKQLLGMRTVQTAIRLRDAYRTFVPSRRA